MEYSFVRENREFMRIPTEVPVKFRFLSDLIQAPEMNVVHSGATAN